MNTPAYPSAAVAPTKSVAPAMSRVRWGGLIQRRPSRRQRVDQKSHDQQERDAGKEQLSAEAKPERDSEHQQRSPPVVRIGVWMKRKRRR